MLIMYKGTKEEQDMMKNLIEGNRELFFKKFYENDVDVMKRLELFFLQKMKKKVKAILLNWHNINAIQIEFINELEEEIC